MWGKQLASKREITERTCVTALSWNLTFFWNLAAVKAQRSFSTLCSWLVSAAFEVSVLIPGVTLLAVVSFVFFLCSQGTSLILPFFSRSTFYWIFATRSEWEELCFTDLQCPSKHCPSLKPWSLKQYLKKQTNAQVVSGKDYIPLSQIRSSSNF